MVDKEFCMSSYLALRYVEKRGTDFCGKLQYSNPVLPSDEERISVHTANDIGMAIKQQLDKVRGGIGRQAFFFQEVWIRPYLHRICPDVRHTRFAF